MGKESPKIRYSIDSIEKDPVDIEIILQILEAACQNNEKLVEYKFDTLPFIEWASNYKTGE